MGDIVDKGAGESDHEHSAITACNVIRGWRMITLT